MSFIPLAQAGLNRIPTELPIHALYPEDFEDGIICPTCAENSRNKQGYNFTRYYKTIAQVHGPEAELGLQKWINRKQGKGENPDEFLVSFGGNQPAVEEHDAKGLIAMLRRLNKAKEEFAR